MSDVYDRVVELSRVNDLKSDKRCIFQISLPIFPFILNRLINKRVKLNQVFEGCFLLLFFFVVVAMGLFVG